MHIMQKVLFHKAYEKTILFHPFYHLATSNLTYLCLIWKGLFTEQTSKFESCSVPAVNVKRIS